MFFLFRRNAATRLGLTALVLACELATGVSPSFAQTQPPATAQGQAQAQAQTASAAVPDICRGSNGPADYPVSGGGTHGGGWFYSEEACRWPAITGYGPARARGYTVLDDDKGNFWTEFRRFGGVDVLGYPVSQPYHYPVGSTDGYWYQAFERGILQFHPETGRAEMANVFEQFTEVGLDPTLQYFGIPLPQQVGPSLTANANGELTPIDPGRSETDQRMSWLTEPRFLARYFFNPVAFHSSDADLAGQTSFATQEQAWAFFGLPQDTAQRLVMRTPATASTPSQELWPLYHAFTAQRFQKAGLELFQEDLPPTTEQFDVPPQSGDALGQVFDPTIVPGDGKQGCLVLTAVGLLARTIGSDKLIPRTAIQPTPPDPAPKPYFTTWVPLTTPGQLDVQFQIDGTTFQANGPITIKLTEGQAPTEGTVQGRLLPDQSATVDHANSDGSFNAILDVPVGTYTITATSTPPTTPPVAYGARVDLAVATVDSVKNRTTTTCQTIGLPTGN